MSRPGIIFAPVVSEKSFRLAPAGQYTFRVDPRAPSPAIAAAIGALYGVSVTAIRTANQRGKATRYRGRAGQRSATKKAIVTLAAGQRIAGFEVETPESAKPTKVSKASAAPKASEASKQLDEAPRSSKSGVTTKVRSATQAEAQESK